MSPPPQTAQAVNLGFYLILACSLPLIGFFVYIVVNSPIFAPVFRILAAQAMKHKKYAWAAKFYSKLHFFQHEIEGLKYAKLAAQAYEFNGDLRKAQESYREAEEWPKLGQMLIEAGKMEQAKELFLEQQLFSRLAQVYELEEDDYQAAQVYHFQLNNLHKAESAYRRAMRASDTEVRLSAQLQLARLYHQRQRRKEAQALLQESLDEINSSPQFQEFPELLKIRDQVMLQLSAT